MVSMSPVTPPPSYLSAVTADRPAVYYRLGETGCCLAVDSSGHNFNATYASSGIFYRQPGLLVGDSDTAILTTGAGTAVTAGDSVLPSSTQRTVELWEKSYSSAWQTFVSYGVSIGGQLFMVSTRGPSFLDMIGAGDDAQFATPYPINDGKAHYLAITYDGGVTVTGYVDGQQIGQTRLPSPLTTTLGSGLQIGGGIDGPFSGTLDEVAIYLFALTPTQINAHWNAGVAAGCAASPTGGYAGAVAADNPSRYWRLGETGGAAAIDSSGNCRNATYAPGATHGIGLILGDSDGSVGNPTPVGTILSASPDALPGGRDPRTVEFWERTTATYQSFLSYGWASDGGFYFMVSMRTPTTLVFVSANNNAVFTTPYPISDGIAHHIALTYDGGYGLTAFLDGQRLGQAAIQALNTVQGSKALEIGNGVDGPFVGTLDEVATYPRALTTAQLNRHWQAGVLAPTCPSAPTSGYAQAVVNDHPVRYWRLGDSSGPAALDYSGNCADAAYGSGVYHVPGLISTDPNGAATSAAQAGTIASASADGLPIGTAPRTIEFWEQSTNPWQSFVSYGWNNNGGFYFMVSSHGGSYLTFIGGNLNAVFPTPFPLNDGVAHHIALTYDGVSMMTAYLDGQQIGQAQLGHLNTDGNTQAVQIGNGIDGPFVGTMSEVAMYPSALSAAQIAAHDDAGGSVIAGTVIGANNAPMAGATVEVCTGTPAPACLPQTVTTGSSGAFMFRVPAGSYAVTAFPPVGSGFAEPATVGPVQVPQSVRNVTVTFSAPLPDNGTFNGQQGGSPTVYWTLPATYTVTGCKVGYGFLVLIAANTTTGQQDAQVVPLIETPPGSGTYVANIPPLAPMHGPATVLQMISCPGTSTVFPAGGPPAGGTKVILDVGSSFDQVTAVTFGTQPAQSFKVLAGGYMLAVSPPGSGTVPVTVSTPTNPSRTLGTFTYSEVTGLSSGSGPQVGGNQVTITGSGFTDVQGVTFGGVPSPSFTVTTSTQIVAQVPPGLVGLADVIVVGLHHTTASVASDLYQYVATHALPAAVDLTKALAARVIAQYLAALGFDVMGTAGGGAAVSAFFDILLADGVGGIIVSAIGTAAQIVLTAARAEAAGVMVGVLLDVAPLILGALVVVAAVAVIVLIIWLLFIDPSGTVVDTAGNPVSGATATLLRQAGPSQPFAPVGASSGTLTPAVNPETTGSSGIFHWDAIAGSYEVQVGASGCAAPGNSAQTTVTTQPFVIPPPAVGLLLTLSCPGSKPPVPTVTGTSPNFGLAAGGSQVEITGSGLAGVTTVHFGGAPAQGVTVLSPYSLIATAPPGASGSAVDVTVTTSGGTSATSTADLFGYYMPAVTAGSPTISSVSPPNGAVVGGTLVTINGTNLGSTTGVFFGNTPSTAVTIVSATQVTAMAPASLLTGRVDLTIYNAAGPSAPSAGDVYYYGSAIPSTTTVAASANPSVFGQPVTFQATVSAGAAGSVQFAVDGTNFGSSVALSGGQAASPSTNTLSVGSHAVTATYAGGGGFLGSSGSLTQTVNKAATSTSIVSSQTPSFMNGPVTFTATVAARPPGAGVPSGTVQFAANGTNLGSPVTLSGGQASYTTSSLAPGHYAVTATYSGDANFLSSVSSSITQAVRNNLIAFSSTRDGNLELYIMQPDGTVQTRLTFNSAQDSEPVLSPDGTRVAFVSNRSGYPNIWVMKTALESSTNVPKNLTNDAAVDADPTWSPDGTKIVFASNRSGKSQLWLMNADGTGVSRLTTDSANDLTAAWSPDGMKIAYASDAGGKFQLYVATLTANFAIGSTSRLTNDSAYDTTPAWSPDSRLIAFTSTASWNPEIWVIGATGGTAVRETSNPTAADTVPAWSPDGSKIAFTFAQNSSTQVYVIMFNPTGLGTQQAALTTGSTNQLPNWCCIAAP
jgi:Tol biopolymer transport system component